MVTLEQLQAGIVLPIDKPHRWTSFQAVNKIKATIRHAYGLKKFKIGHAGTLDPLATGLLLVCVGKATKQIDTLQQGTKTYTGTIVLGATTPCYDLERPIDHYYPYDHITPELIAHTLSRFTGDILQVPPMFSAVKIDGQRAYEYARTDDPTATIQPKPVTVYTFEVTAFRNGSKSNGGSQQTTPITETPERHLYNNPLGHVPTHLPQLDFRIVCGKGTYIRSLARDLGLAVGSGAFLSELRRESVGEYTVDNALSLDQVEGYLTGE